MLFSVMHTLPKHVQLMVAHTADSVFWEIFMVALWVLKAVCDGAPICLKTAESFCDVHTTNCRVSHH